MRTRPADIDGFFKRTLVQSLVQRVPPMGPQKHVRGSGLLQSWFCVDNMAHALLMFACALHSNLGRER